MRHCSWTFVGILTVVAVALVPAPLRAQNELRDRLERQFEARQDQLRKELAGFRARLDEIERTIESRERLKKEIIDQRIEDLRSGAAPAGSAIEPASSAQRRSPALGQVELSSPAKARVQWIKGVGGFTSRWNQSQFHFNLGEAATFRISEIPERQGIGVFVTVEMAKPTAATRDFVQNNAIDLKITNEELDQVAAGKTVVKTFFLPRQLNAGGDLIQSITSTGDVAGADAMKLAQSQGALLATVRIQQRLNFGGDRQPLDMNPPRSQYPAMPANDAFATTNGATAAVSGDLQVLRVKVKAAQAKLKRLTQVADMIPSTKLREAEASLALALAELAASQRRYDEQTQLLRLDVEAAMANLKAVESELKDVEKLHRAKYISDAEYERARTKTAQAELAVRRAEIRLRTHLAAGGGSSNGSDADSRDSGQGESHKGKTTDGDPNEEPVTPESDAARK